MLLILKFCMPKLSKLEKQNRILKQVEELFSKAKDNPTKGNFYVHKLRKIAMKVNLRLPHYLKQKFCKHCYSYFYKENYRVRTRNKFMVYYCNNCKKYSKYGLKPKSSCSFTFFILFLIVF